MSDNVVSGAFEQEVAVEFARVVLCSECEACPSVEIDRQGVSIGEEENVVRLTHAQWNDLVARIRSGELKAVEQV